LLNLNTYKIILLTTIIYTKKMQNIIKDLIIFGFLKTTLHSAIFYVLLNILVLNLNRVHVLTIIIHQQNTIIIVYISLEPKI